MEKLSFKLDNFEGPLDLLLYLIDKNKVNIYDIPLSQITDQYLEYLNELSTMDMEFSSEFLVMASQLLYIKSRMLLPKHNEIEEESEEDPREELVARLIEYKKYKEASLFLQEREPNYRNTFFKSGDPIEIPARQNNLIDLSIEDLLKAVGGIMKKNISETVDIKDTFSDMIGVEKIPIKSKMSEILSYLDIHREIYFLKLFDNMISKAEIVAQFLAILELIKLDMIIIQNKSQQIYIYRSIKNGEKDEY